MILASHADPPYSAAVPSRGRDPHENNMLLVLLFANIKAMFRKPTEVGYLIAVNINNGQKPGTCKRISAVIPTGHSAQAELPCHRKVDSNYCHDALQLLHRVPFLPNVVGLHLHPGSEFKM